MAGGTGGHIYPALACAQEFRKRGYNILWLGSKSSMEESLVPQHGFALKTIAIKGVRGKGLMGLLLAPFRILQALIQSLVVLHRFKPSVVLGMGGFVAGPGGVAAKILGVPLVIHEQNAIAGTTNKLLAKLANRVLQAFSGVLPKGHTVGNPVRSNILKREKKVNDVIAVKSLKLLVVGGSLGAQYINQLMPKFIDSWDDKVELDVWHQTGNRNIDEIQKAYAELDVDAKVSAYIEDMDEAYHWADLVLCRAGAMTVSELAIVGLPSILVPYPYAIDDHQTANAMCLVNAGAAKILPQKQLTMTELSRLLNELLEDDQILIKMGLAAGQVAYPEATSSVVDECERFIKND